MGRNTSKPPEQAAYIISFLGTTLSYYKAAGIIATPLPLTLLRFFSPRNDHHNVFLRVRPLYGPPLFSLQYHIDLMLFFRFLMRSRDSFKFLLAPIKLNTWLAKTGISISISPTSPSTFHWFSRTIARETSPSNIA